MPVCVIVGSLNPVHVYAVQFYHVLHDRTVQRMPVQGSIMCASMSPSLALACGPSLWP